MNKIHLQSFYRIKSKRDTYSKILLICASTTIVLLIIQIIGLQNNYTSFLNACSYIGLFLTAITTIIEFYNKDDLSFLMCQHKNLSEKYKFIRDEYMSLIEEIMSISSDDKTLRQKSIDLQKRYSYTGENAPETTSEDYEQTQLKLGLELNKKEEFTWSDKDINKFLPEKLRLDITL